MNNVVARFQNLMIIGWKRNSDSYDWSISKAIVFQNPMGLMACGKTRTGLMQLVKRELD